jgi:hypothetical protein
MPTINLHREIKANRALGAMCRSLHIFIAGTRGWDDGDIQSEDFQLAEELLSWLPNVESFHLQAEYHHPLTWPVLNNAIRQMPQIRKLTLNRHSWNLYIAPVGALIRTMQLDSLRLFGISAEKNGSTWAPLKVIKTYIILHGAKLTLTYQQFERTLPISRIEVCDFGETQQTLYNLLKLSKELKHFQFDGVGCIGNWSLNTFSWLLEDHRETLKSIKISGVQRDYGDLSFLDFTNLETLNISRWVIDFTPEVACSKFLAPRLHTFVWDFATWDQHNEQWHDFGTDQKEWIVKFGEVAAAQKSALRRIKIVFTPDRFSCPWPREELMEVVFPWKLMDEAAEILRPLGIQLSWNDGGDETAGSGPDRRV